VVLPFYVYAALAFLVGCILLFTSSGAFTQHYFHPHTIAITHIMALGWGTMMVLGAGHQLLPVVIEGKLYSDTLAWLSFVFAAVGIPLLVFAFYHFNMGWPAQYGGILVNIAIVCYLVNVAASMMKSSNENVHAVFVFTATLWLLLTTTLGLVLVYNFTYTFLPKDSLQYFSLHAHLGIGGWFLLMVVGVGTRLLPMFLISKYTNPRRLWLMYGLINAALILFIITHVYLQQKNAYLFAVISVLSGFILFAIYLCTAYRQRIRKQLDEQMKVSFLSVLIMVVPLMILVITMVMMLMGQQLPRLVLVYGFTIFLGWITAIIFGMTFKTLPFIVWNKVYQSKAGLAKTPHPKDLFSRKIFIAMSIAYLVGFVLFIAGILVSIGWLLKIAAAFLVAAAMLYNWNVFKIVLHQSKNV